MKILNTTSGARFNPPLRIFSVSGTVDRPTNALRFSRPQIKSLVNRDRVARYFTRRGFSFGSSLD